MPRRPALLAPCVLALCLAGCGDMATFSHISREQGIKDYDAGDYDHAEGAFADAIRQNPRDYKSYTYLGQLYARKAEYQKALAAYKSSLDTMPLTVQGQADDEFRAKTLTLQADALAKLPGDTALDDLEAKAAASTTGEESYQLARIYAGRGDADSAIAAYNRAALQAPGQFYIAKAQGLYLARQGQKTDAEQALRRAYRMYDKDDEVNAALRGLGVVPGPSLKDPEQLQKPVVPLGPIPNYLDRMKQPAPAETPPVQP